MHFHSKNRDFYLQKKQQFQSNFAKMAEKFRFTTDTDWNNARNFLQKNIYTRPVLSTFLNSISLGKQSILTKNTAIFKAFKAKTRKQILSIPENEQKNELGLMQENLFL